MPANSARNDKARRSQARLIKEKLLCDLLFGATDADAYEQAAGRPLGAFTLCIAAYAGQGMAAMAAMLRSIAPRGTVVFACAPGRVALLTPHGKKGGELAAAVDRACLQQGLPELFLATGEGRGAAQLQQSYLDCRRIVDGLLAAENGNGQGIPATAVRPALSRAMEYISQNYTGQVTLVDAAAHAFASPCYISRLFRRELGIGFSDYLGGMRVQQAKTLLVNTGLKVFEVADRVGIADAHYFARLFRKHTGLSPGEYRSENSNKNAFTTIGSSTGC